MQILVSHPNHALGSLVVAGVRQSRLASGVTGARIRPFGSFVSGDQSLLRSILPRVDALIGTIDPDTAAALTKHGVIGVETSGLWPAPAGGTSVACDLAGCAELAADHLCSRGHRRLAWIGPSRRPMEAIPLAAWEVALSRRGLVCERFDPWEKSTGDLLEDFDQAGQRLAAWIGEEPVGTLVHDPWSGRRLYELLASDASASARLHVVCLDEHPVATTAAPGLSCLPIPWRAIGHAAGDAVALIRAGHAPPPPQRLVPAAVRVRLSSDPFVCSDSDVIAAITFMRANLQRPITMREVAAASHCSQRHLYRVFRRQCSLSPAAVLQHLRMEGAAHRLLTEEQASTIDDLARAFGYRHRQQFQAAFKRFHGRSVSDFRRFQGQSVLVVES